MMHEDEKCLLSSPERSRSRSSPPDILHLSRDDYTWGHFQGLDTVADIALTGE